MGCYKNKRKRRWSVSEWVKIGYEYDLVRLDECDRWVYFSKLSSCFCLK